MIEFTDAYKEAARQFRRTFQYAVPTAMIPPRTETEDLIARILQCVESGEDTLLASYGVKVDQGDLV